MGVKRASVYLDKYAGLASKISQLWSLGQDQFKGRGPDAALLPMIATMAPTVAICTILEVTSGNSGSEIISLEHSAQYIRGFRLATIASIGIGVVHDTLE